MSPPLYADVDKKVRDIFSKGYNFGILKLDLKTKPAPGLETSGSDTYTIDSGKNAGSAELKYKVEEHGITLTEKINTDSVLVTDITFQKDSVVPGLKAGVEATFAPYSGHKSGKVKGEYKQDLFAGNLIVDMPPSGPLFHASGVVGQDGFLAGGQVSFDTSTSQLTKTSVGLGYDVGDMAVMATATDGHEYTGAGYYRVNGETEAGIQATWSTGADSGLTRLGVGAKYVVNSDITVGGKLNNLCQLGLSYQHKIRDGVTGTISAMIDGKNLNAEGGHKFGVGLDVEI